MQNVGHERAWMKEEKRKNLDMKPAEKKWIGRKKYGW